MWSLNEAVRGTRQAASAHVDTMEHGMAWWHGAWHGMALQRLFKEALLPLSAMEEDCKVHRFDPAKLLAGPRFEKLRARCEKRWPGWEDRWLAQRGADVAPPATALCAGVCGRLTGIDPDN